MDKNILYIRGFTFLHCHTKHDRDLRASINIRNYALAIIDYRYKIR